MKSSPDYSHLVLLDPPSRRRVLICYSSANHFDREVLSGVLQFSQEGEPWRIEYATFNNIVQKFQDFMPDGLLWIGDSGHKSKRNEEADVLTELGKLGLNFQDIELSQRPILLISPTRWAQCPSICIDEDDLGLMAADYLFSRSPSSYLYFGERNAGEVRESSFISRLKESGVAEYQISSLFQGDRAQFLTLVRQKVLPLAIYCESDVLGKTIIDWLADEGLSVPQKVIVLGTGDDPHYCNACVPSLSSIVLKFSQSGYDGAKQLQNMMNQEEAEGRLKFITPKNIHERGSCSPFKSLDPRLLRSMQYYLDHMEKGQNVEEVCRFSELPYRSFHRLFKDSIGLSPKSWMEAEQFKRAKNLLENSREKLSVVAQKCGYSDDKALIRSFRRLGRHNPSHYRKTAKN